jgi:hypothetical protein
MEIVCTADMSRPGNDCYINESVSVLKEFDEVYTVIRTYKVSGWADRLETDVLLVTESASEAGKRFNEYRKHKM